MKSKRTTSVCSSSTRTSTDEVDGGESSDESDDSDDEDKPVNDVPVTFEYVYGSPSTAVHFKLPKSAEPTTTTTTITSSQSVGASSSRKGTKLKSSTAQVQSIAAAKKHHQQLVQEPIVDSSSDESCTDVVSTNQSLFLKLLTTIREFFYNRKNWSVTEESIIIWFGFMFFAVVVGCILHFLMA
jgi:hypothetical protein